MKYTILKNWHYSIFNPLKHKWIRLDCQEVRFKFVIPKNAWFSKENEDDEDWNKLYGVSYGLFGIHKNSLRIAWKPDFEVKNKFQLAYYAYENGKKVTKKICSVFGDCQYEGQIYLHNDGDVSVFINDDYRYFDKCDVRTSYIAFTCKPYHGGDGKSKNKYAISIN